MSLLFLLLVVVVLLGSLGVVFYLYSGMQSRFHELQNQIRNNIEGNTQFIQTQMGQLTSQINSRLGESATLSSKANQQINERLDNAARFFADLQNKLGKLDEANEKIYNVGKDISSLQEILRNPKARGTLGEFLLADLLGEMLPRDRFALQYSFKSNEKVDAVIYIGGQMIPIDSKFPLENFRRLVATNVDEEKRALKKQFLSDVKKHVDSISRKYILPEEGTFEFALMYIPAENVFYESIVRDEENGQEESLQAYALRKKVIAVSPNSFYAYLAALLHALRGERMQKNIFEMVSQMRHLVVDLGKFRDDFGKIGFHLGNLRKSYEDASIRLDRYADRLDRLQEVESVTEGTPAVKLIS